MSGGVTAHRPYVLLSVAMSADGYIDDSSTRRLILSGEADLDRVDAERARCDAIMVGAGTIRSDDPRLLLRSAARRQQRLADGRPADPAKVTITRRGELDPGARFFADDGAAKLVYAADAAAPELKSRLGSRASVIPMPAGSPLAWVLTDLAIRQVSRLMIEGGGTVLGEALAAGLADELQLAVAPVFVGDPAAPRLLTGSRIPGRMELAGVERAGDVAVLRYLPGSQRP